MNYGDYKGSKFAQNGIKYFSYVKFGGGGGTKCSKIIVLFIKF